jgi:hypothetical protein
MHRTRFHKRKKLCSQIATCARCSGNLLPPSAPTEKATARQDQAREARLRRRESFVSGTLCVSLWLRAQALLVPCTEDNFRRTVARRCQKVTLKSFLYVRWWPTRPPPRLCGVPASCCASSQSICSMAPIPAVRQKRSKELSTPCQAVSRQDRASPGLRRGRIGRESLWLPPWPRTRKVHQLWRSQRPGL